MKKVILKPGREKPLLQRHPWIFSGAVEKLPPFSDGDLLPVYTSADAFIGIGYFNQRTSILGRMLTFRSKNVAITLREKIKQALYLRTLLFDPKKTTGYRLINAEGDGIPGLIVDRYADVLVIQIATSGMNKLKSKIIALLQEILSPRAIYEKSTSSSRTEEGLESFEGFILGGEIEEVVFLENGLQCIAPILHGQKTGFFLDQREMRALVERLSQGKRVFNGFAYTGGFSLFALRGGANEVMSVDTSETALREIEKQIAWNGLQGAHTSVSEDLFDYLRKQPLPYDLIILDPPAFAKKRSDVDRALSGYKDLNRLAIQKAPPGALLLSSSCSAHIDSKLFQMVLFQAASEAERSVKIIGRHILAPDHPISLYHPEGEYLKSLLLQID